MNLSDLLTQFSPFSTLIAKAKTAKTVPEIIDAVAKIPGTAGLLIFLCKEMVESKIFFGGEYSEALDLLSRLVKELLRNAMELTLLRGLKKKLSQMILDKKIGTLDQGAGCLVVSYDPKTDATDPSCIGDHFQYGQVC
ncbi:hypothetical protein H0E87_016084 [Populus deltoides]|uniref:DED domain-containing protein n=1 Tax=Populus deltoides TaxID=3696 RepID=A0A8T2Y7I1_POPDE|nr:hypothetical protein H0E87_016084 [Populus deltoides]